MSKVIVIGGGPAGVIAACTAAQNGHAVTLIERNKRIGRKLMITGKGRCNVTNYCTDVQELIDMIPVNGRFLYSAFSSFMTYDTMSLFEELGVPLKVERGNRVFPVSDKSVDIVDALDRYLHKCRVKVVNARADSILADSDGGKVIGVKTDDGTSIPCDAVVLATGGLSYPSTGSTGDGYRMAEKLGHVVTELSPSLVPMECIDSCCREMQGLALKNIEIRILENGDDENGGNKVIYTDFGEMLFTHFGVSGPVILSSSSHIRDIETGRYSLHIDLKPALTAEQLDARIQRDFQKLSNKDFQNSLGGLLPAKMIPVIVRRSGIDPQKKVNQITKAERMLLVSLIKSFVIDISGFRPISEAIITSGGIEVKEINPKTMESKLISGLYFAGEIIDTDAYTGGFNLQIAFSTGYLAGKSIT